MRMILSRLPFMLGFVALMVMANLAAGTLNGTLPGSVLRAWGISHADIQSGELHRLITGTFLSHDLGMFLRQVCFATAVIGLYEWRQGTARAFAMFAAIDILGTLFVLFAVLAPLDDGPWEALVGISAMHDVGMSAGGFGLLGALVATLPHRNLLCLATLAAIAIKVWIAFEPIADLAHLVTFAAGLVLQSLWGGRRGTLA